MRLYPFAALRPEPHLAAAVACPPYDVVSRREAARLAAGNPRSFLHVVRAEINLPESVDAYDPRVYAAARAALTKLVAQGVLVRETAPALYLYREVLQGRAQVGVVGCVHVDDYEAGVIRRHEATRPDKENDRTRHVLALRAHAEPVLLAYRGRPELDRLAGAATDAPPLLDFTAPDGVRHTLWRLADPGPWVEAFEAVPRAYIADGHHRSAGAWRAARELLGSGQASEEALRFPAVLVPADALRILPYNRLVRDLGGLWPEQVLARLGRLGRLVPAGDPVPERPGVFCLYLAGRWHRLELDAGAADQADPAARLDASLLHERVLGPALDLGDPRTEPRLEFLGGMDGPAPLARRVDAGEMALAVSLHPTRMEDLMAVADAGAVMPPKSTWFEPKLGSGLFVHLLD